MIRNGGNGKPTPEDKKRDGDKALAERRADADAVNKNTARLPAKRTVILKTKRVLRTSKLKSSTASAEPKKSKPHRVRNTLLSRARADE